LWGRLARVIAVGVAHHVTQRGNGRRFLLDSDADRRIYLDLLQQNLRLHEVLLVGYSLMSNHVWFRIQAHDELRPSQGPASVCAVVQ
jgi:putative transposase